MSIVYDEFFSQIVSKRILIAYLYSKGAHLHIAQSTTY